MLQVLKVILNIQELDMKMIRLMRLKKERLKEIEHIDSLRQELQQQQVDKQEEIAELNRTIINQEAKISEIKEKIKKLETKQNSVKKVDEFNALNQEMTTSERERVATEQITSDLIDKRNLEEEILGKIKDGRLVHEINIHDSKSATTVLRNITRRISMSLLMAALLVCSTILVSNNPENSFAQSLFVATSILAMFLVLRYLFTTKSR